MHKSFLVLSVLCLTNAVFAAGTYDVWTENNTGSTGSSLHVPYGSRYCYCLSRTQTALIDGTKGGNVKLFSKSDCTGNYVDGSGKITYNAQWINSVSFGESGIPSTWGGGTFC